MKLRAGDYERDRESGLLLPRHARRGVEREHPQFMYGPAFFGGDPRDPYWASVVAALHMDGANNSTTFTDHRGTTWTASGTAKISTTRSVFGGSSGAFDGTANCYVSTAASADFAFGTGDFTIEFWIYANNVTPEQALVCMRLGSASIFNNVVRIAAGLIGWSDGSSWVGGSTALPATTWTHIAITRAGSTLRVFQGGAVVYSGGNALNISTNRPAFLGAYDNNPTALLFDGYLDDVRITKGVARYTAAYTPPTAAFPNS